MLGMGMSELIVIFVIALIFIGPKKLPELAKGLGKGLKEFQKATKGITDSIHEVVNESDKSHENVEPAKVADATQRDEFLYTETPPHPEVVDDATRKDDFQHTEVHPKKDSDKQS